MRNPILRVGRKVGRTLYMQVGDEPSDDDPLVGVMDTRELAAYVSALTTEAAHRPPTPKSPVSESGSGVVCRPTEGETWSADEALAIAETGFDNIARLAELNAEEPGWQVEVHRIACECWRQVKDARAALSSEDATRPTGDKA